MAFACLRSSLTLNTTLRRNFATTSRVLAAVENHTYADVRRHQPLPPPESKTFYTGRSNFYDYVASLELAIRHTRTTLKELQLMPLPEFALQSLPPAVGAWKSKEELVTSLSASLSAARHRRLLGLLNELSDFRRIARTAGHEDLAVGIDNVLAIFERPDKEQHLRRGQRKPVTLDDFGRTYTVGRRKTSSARVWMISSEHAAQARARAGQKNLPVTEVLVNNVPLNEYFKIPIDREKILRPLRLTGLLGAYNVFALVRGGGISGQAGALAHGVAKGIAAHVPDIEIILRRGQLVMSLFLTYVAHSSIQLAKLLRRDPRMVERKKTGRAKARKGVSCILSITCVAYLTIVYSTLGSSVSTDYLLPETITSFISYHCTHIILFLVLTGL